MHHDPDTHRSGIADVEFTSADQWNITETSVACGGRREGGVKIIRRREQHADDVLMVDSIAINHLVEKRDRSLLDVIDGINVDGGGTAQGPD